MRRSILAALTLGLVVIGTSGATLLISRWKDRAPAAVLPVRAAQPSARNATTPLPSLKNRIAVSNAQLRDAYAAGQIDQSGLINPRKRRRDSRHGHADLRKGPLVHNYSFVLRFHKDGLRPGTRGALLHDLQK